MSFSITRMQSGSWFICYNIVYSLFNFFFHVIFLIMWTEPSQVSATLNVTFDQALSN